MLIVNNTYQGLAWFRSSNKVVARVMEVGNQVNEYLDLRETNKKLAEENARLNARLSNLSATLQTVKLDSMKQPEMSQYQFVVAKVINNSTYREDNYITINKGSAHGLRPGMGVIAPTGVVGRVVHCSENYATITSLLHRKQLISAIIKRVDAFGTLKWNGNSPKQASLNYIARHVKPKPGDTVVTSAYSTVFPAGVMCGKISSVKIKDNDTFYDIVVDLSTDYSTLNFVYIITNNLKPEQDSLQSKTDPLMNEY